MASSLELPLRAHRKLAPQEADGRSSGAGQAQTGVGQLGER